MVDPGTASLLTAVCTMPLHAKAWQEALAPMGLRVSRRTIYEWEGESGTVTARRAGARLVLAVTTSLPKTALHEAHLVVRSVGQLCARLEQLVIDKPVLSSIQYRQTGRSV